MNNETPNYTQMGIAALIPGMQHMIVLMEKELDKIRGMLAAAQAQVGPETARDYINGDRRGAYWQTMTPDERSAEVKRRRKVSARKRKAAAGDAPTHPRDPRHPGHEQWIARLRAAQKKVWGAKSKAQRRAQAVKMHEAKAVKRAERAAA